MCKGFQWLRRDDISFTQIYLYRVIVSARGKRREITPVFIIKLPLCVPCFRIHFGIPSKTCSKRQNASYVIYSYVIHVVGWEIIQKTAFESIWCLMFQKMERNLVSPTCLYTKRLFCMFLKNH